MSVYAKVLITALFIVYPFVVYYGLMNFALWQIAGIIMIFAGIRLFVLKNATSQFTKVGFYGSLALIIFSLLSLLLNQQGWLKLYPIVISLMSFTLFFASLFSDKSAIWRIAEIREKNIDAKKQKYMYKLTIIWCVFFIINAAISSYTMCCMTLKQWALYNGFFSYIVMGCLFAGELLYRHAIIKRTSS